MKNKGNIGTTFVVIILSAFIFVFGGAGFTKREPNTYYAVYVDGKKIGMVDSAIKFDDYINTQEEKLKEKYGVDIVFNDRYDTCNNINSLYIVRDRFHDTYVMEGDVYMDKNVLLSEVSQSTYFAKKKKYENEWGLEVDENNKLVKINIGAGNGFLMSGISYWKADDCKKIINHMEEVYATKDYTNLYWDNMVLDIYPELDIHVKEIKDIYEIDTPEELKEVELKIK